jgi:hypothetical protein
VKNSGIRYDMSAWMHVDMQHQYLAKYDSFDEDKNTFLCFEMDWAIQQKRISKRTKLVSAGNN